MCGIVGYAGSKNALPILIHGLKKLEYRGYDSSGIAVLSQGSIFIEKSKGNISNLESKLSHLKITSNIGIGHTRWATHGEPSDINSHPHTNSINTIAIVHNGIIENYIELKHLLQNNLNIKLKSETDTEVIAHLIDHLWNGNLLSTLYKVVQKLTGSYAISVIAKDDPDKIIAVRKDSPLIIGIGENENFIASDIPAILKYTRKVLLIENNEFVEITKDSIKIYDEFENPIERKEIEITWQIEEAEKENFDHFTLKEIHEQPRTLKNTLNNNINGNKLNIQDLNITEEELRTFNKFYIVGCGTAYNAGLIGKYIFRKFAHIDINCEIASEFRYNDPIIDDKTLVICISQSGETLDTIQSLRLAKEKGAKILSIVNIVGSSITRESDYIFYTIGGPEIGVASTKIFTCQLLALNLIALKFGKLLNILDDKQVEELLKELKTIPEKAQTILDDKQKIKDIAQKQFKNENIFYMGRNIDMDISFESSLKLKEISYINSFAIGAGELKHGTIALVDDKTFVVALSTQEKLIEKMIANIKEVKARGAKVLTVTKETTKFSNDCCDEIILIPETLDIFTPLLSIIPMQLLAYYISTLRGNNVDKPRNLAKSVTVE